MRKSTRANYLRGKLMAEIMLMVLLLCTLTGAICISAGYFIGRACERKYCTEIIKRLYEEERDADLYRVFQEIQ